MRDVESLHHGVGQCGIQVHLHEDRHCDQQHMQSVAHEVRGLEGKMNTRVRSRAVTVIGVSFARNLSSNPCHPLR